MYVPVRQVATLYALAVADGEEQWQFECDGGYLQCSPVVSDDRVYVGDNSGNMYAVDPTSGVDEWHYDKSRLDFDNAVAAAGGRLFVNFGMGTVAFDAESGEELWRSRGSHTGCPVVYDDVVYTATNDEGIRGYDVETGEAVVSLDTEAYTTYSPVCADGVLYAATDNDTIEAFDTDSEEHRWSIDVDSGVSTSVTVAGRGLFVVGAEADEELKLLTEDTEPIQAETTTREMDVRDALGEASTDTQEVEAESEPLQEVEAESEPITGPITADGEWPTTMGVRTRTGYAGGGFPESKPTDLSWKVDGVHRAQPIIAYGSVITTCETDTVRAYDIETGEPFWECDVGDCRQNTGVVAAHSTVFGGNKAGEIFAIDAETGEMEWRVQPEVDGSSEVATEPTVHNGTVYAPINNSGVVCAIEAETGEKQWTFECESSYLECTPAVSDEFVYVGDEGGSVYCIGAASGVEQWQFEERMARFSTAPAVVAGSLFINGGNDLYALDAANGETLWRSTNFHHGSPTVADGVVFAGATDAVVGYDPETGEAQTTYSTDCEKNYTLTYADNHLYVGTSDGTVDAFDARTAEHRWSYDLDGTVPTRLAVGDGALFVRRSDGDSLVALTADADEIEADASIEPFDARTGERIEVETTDTTDPDTEFRDAAIQQIGDPRDPTDDELQAVILGEICDAWMDSNQIVRLTSTEIKQDVADRVPGATSGLVYYNLEQLAENSYIGWKPRNQYYSVVARPEAIYYYEQLTDTEVIEQHELIEVLDVLYERSRHHPRNPAVTREQLQSETFLEDDALDRIVWYLDNIGEWIEDVLIVMDQTGYVETRAVGGGAFWHEAELNGAGKDFYDTISQ